MAKQKTQPTDSSVTAFLDTIADEKKRTDSYAILELMQQATGYAPKMWGPAIVGFGSYHYKYDSGHEGDAPLTGFSPRKEAFTFYLMLGSFDHSPLLEKLGKHKTGKGCLYIKKLEDVDTAVLKTMVTQASTAMKEKYPGSL
jgi:hypothetical protein